MNLFKLSWKNLIHKPLATMLSVLLLALGVGLIILLLLANKQIQDKFEKNLAGIDLIIAAKGSKLQSVLCNMYHVDDPTGNISIGEIKPFLNPKHPLIKNAIPISLGDSYAGFRIVGTTHSYVDLYDSKIAKGKLWKKTFDVTIGYQVAKKIKLGDKFLSTHGLIDDENLVHDHQSKFVVVGILEESGTVLDQLILTNTESVWTVHDHEGHDDEHEKEHKHEEHGGEHAKKHDEHNHDKSSHSNNKDEGHEHEKHSNSEHKGHDHDGNDKEHDHEGENVEKHDEHNHGKEKHSKNEHKHDEAGHENHTIKEKNPNLLLSEKVDKEITALLIQYRSKTNFRALNLGRNIDEKTDMQAASPAIELNRLHSMMGLGIDTLTYLAMLIVFVSGLSVFVSLLNSLKDRKYELALMRVMGASPARLFILVILEGLLLALIGFIVGLLASHIGMNLLADYMHDTYRYPFTGWIFLPEENWVFIGSLILGFLAAIIPAFQAMNTDISKTLAKT